MKRSSVPFIAPCIGTHYNDGVTGADVIFHDRHYYGYICGLNKSVETILSFDLNITERGYSVSNIDGTPCIFPGNGNDFDACGVCDPAMIRYNDRFHMYYSGLGAVSDMIGLAISEDGKQFEKYCLPICEGRAPCAVVKDDKVYLFYVLSNRLGGYDVHLSMSKDGYNFKKVKGAVIQAAGTGFDAKSISTPRIVKIQDAYYCFYCCDDEQKDMPKYFGVARSSDLLKWEKADRPVMERGEQGRFDSEAIWLPSVLWDGEIIHMWYEGAKQDEKGLLVSSIGTTQWSSEEIVGLFE